MSQAIKVFSEVQWSFSCSDTLLKLSKYDVCITNEVKSLDDLCKEETVFLV